MSYCMQHFKPLSIVFDGADAELATLVLPSLPSSASGPSNPSTPADRSDPPLFVSLASPAGQLLLLAVDASPQSVSASPVWQLALPLAAGERLTSTTPRCRLGAAPTWLLLGTSAGRVFALPWTVARPPLPGDLVTLEPPKVLLQ